MNEVNNKARLFIPPMCTERANHNKKKHKGYKSHYDSNEMKRILYGYRMKAL